LESYEWDDEADDGTIGVTDLKARSVVPLFLLMRDESQMVKVHGRHDERYKGVLAIVLCIGEDRDSGGSKRFLYDTVSKQRKYENCKGADYLPLPLHRCPAH